jgi:diaminopimelate decarboxylase
MNAFNMRHGELCVEDVPLEHIAQQFGTPCFVYSRAALTTALAQYRQALEGRDASICYAVKVNSNLTILNLFAKSGAGFDIVSGGELSRVLAAGGEPSRVVFAGVGKSEAELRQALEVGIRCFNVESASELDRLNRLAADMGTTAPIALRVNPDVDPKTHPYISTGLRHNKFGIGFDDAIGLYRHARALSNIRIVGIACHIGSQLLDSAPMVEAAEKVVGLVDTLAAEGIVLTQIDFGGGLGIRYQDESPPSVAEYLGPLLARLAGRKEHILFEPGRSLVGNAGVLLTRIEYLKHGAERNFAIVDAAMNDLIRPALYDAWHEIVAIRPRNAPPQVYEVVGPVCESGDFLGHARSLAIAEGDLLAVMSSGAYAMSMSSNYNSRPRAAEVLVDGSRATEIRRRERAEDLFALESLAG